MNPSFWLRRNRDRDGNIVDETAYHWLTNNCNCISLYYWSMMRSMMGVFRIIRYLVMVSAMLVTWSVLAMVYLDLF